MKLDVYGDEVLYRTINLIYPTIDATTRTFQVEIRLDNKDQRVRPGMFARATLNFGTARNVVVPVGNHCSQARFRRPLCIRL